MSNSTEMLNNILELCEKNMNEGDYLLASEILKNINDKKSTIEDDIIVKMFETPYKLRKVDNYGSDEEEGILTILGIEIKELEHLDNNGFKHEIISYFVNYDDDEDVIIKIKYIKMKAFLMNFMSANLYIDMYISCEEHSMLNYKYFYLKDFKEFLNRIDNSEIELCDDYVYSKYLEHIGMSILRDIRYVL